MPTKRLARDPNHKWVAGVCGGIARWLDADPDIVRLICARLRHVRRFSRHPRLLRSLGIDAGGRVGPAKKP
jgi:PspC domain